MELNFESCFSPYWICLFKEPMVVVEEWLVDLAQDKVVLEPDLELVELEALQLV